MSNLLMRKDEELTNSLTTPRVIGKEVLHILFPSDV